MDLLLVESGILDRLLLDSEVVAWALHVSLSTCVPIQTFILHSDFWEHDLLASISRRWDRKLALVHGYLQLMDVVLSELGLGRV